MIEIRPALHADLDEIVAIENACFTDEAFTRRQLTYLIDQAKGGCFVATDEGKVIGYLSLLARPRYADIRVYSIATAPETRGKGVGSALLERAAEYAREGKAKTITLEVSVTNEAALALYRKNGFESIHRIPGYYHDGGDAWRMKLRLK